MGNQTSLNPSQTSKYLKDYEEVSKTEEGIIYRQKIQDQQTNQFFYQHFILKQHNYPNEQILMRNFEKYQQQIRNNQQPNNQSNTLQVKQAVKEQIKHFCSNSYKIYTLYEYPELNLYNEIEVRSEMNKYFEEEQVIAILQTCLIALQQIRAIICFSTKSIYISPNGVIKVLHNDLVDENYRHLQVQNIYYAPQKFTNFYSENYTENSLKKQIIFSIGMTILQTCLLQNLYSIYNHSKKSFNEKELQDKISNLSNMYSNELVDLLANMLQINPNRRISLLQIQRALNRYDEIQAGTIENEEEKSDMQKKYEQLFEEKNCLASQSVEQPTIPNLLSNQNTSRLSLVAPPHAKYHEEIMPHDITYKVPHIYAPNSFYQYDSISKNNGTANFNFPMSKNLENSISKNQFNTLTSTFNNPKPSSSSENHLFTDPKLLQMIRKDLEQISKSRTSRVIIHTNRDEMNMNHVNQYNYNTSGINNNTQRFQDLNQSHLKDPFKMLDNCPQVESLNASVAREIHNENNIYVYQQSNVKRSPQHLHHSKALSTQNFQDNNSIFQDKQNGLQQKQKTYQNTRAPLRQVNSNQIAKKNLDQIQQQLKKDMMKKKEANLIYLEEIYEDGVKYEGMSKNGLKQGYGKLMYNDGAYYEGYFQADRINGKGILYYNIGHPAYDGQWHDEQFNGFGKLYNEEPEELDSDFPFHNFNFLENYWIKYEGYFQNDNKHGRGKIYLSSKQYLEAQFKQDMVNGQGIFFKRDGSVIKGRWQNNILVEIREDQYQQ